MSASEAKDAFDEMVGPEIEDEQEESESSSPEPAESSPPEASPEATSEPVSEESEPAEAVEDEEASEEPEESDPGSKVGPGGLPRSVIKELQKNRERVRELQREIAEARALQGEQAVTPLPGQSPSGQMGVPQAEIPTVVGEDGRELIDVNALESYMAQREMARAPSPQEQVSQRLQQTRLQFVGENPERNGPASQRIDSAVQMLDLLTDQANQALGYQPRDLNEWEASIATTGGLMQFRESFPEIADVKRLAHAVIAARTGDTQSLRFWMDDYMGTGYRAFEQSVGLVESDTPRAAASGVSGDPVPEAAAPAPSAARLAAKPRSMAQKGATAGGADEDLRSEMAALEKDIGRDPVGVDPKTAAKHERLDEIRRKLKIE